MDSFDLKQFFTSPNEQVYVLDLNKALKPSEPQPDYNFLYNLNSGASGYSESLVDFHNSLRDKKKKNDLIEEYVSEFRSKLNKMVLSHKYKMTIVIKEVNYCGNHIVTQKERSNKEKISKREKRDRKILKKQQRISNSVQEIKTNPNTEKDATRIIGHANRYYKLHNINNELINWPHRKKNTPEDSIREFSVLLKKKEDKNSVAYEKLEATYAMVAEFETRNLNVIKRAQERKRYYTSVAEHKSLQVNRKFIEKVEKNNALQSKKSFYHNLSRIKIDYSDDFYDDPDEETLIEEVYDLYD